jgi:hypothetical protein
MYILSSFSNDSDTSATITISTGEIDHKFDAWKEGSHAYVSYQESCGERGTIRVSEPSEDVYKALMTSHEMTTLLNRWRVSNVQKHKEIH